MKLPKLPKISYIHIITLTIIFELATIFNRFVLKLQLVNYTYIYDWITGGFRIHHIYPGILMILIGYPMLKKKKYLNYGKWLIIVGVAMVLSDLIHHFIVLQWAIGSPEV